MLMDIFVWVVLYVDHKRLLFACGVTRAKCHFSSLLEGRVYNLSFMLIESFRF